MRIVIVGAGSIGARHAAIAARRVETGVIDVDPRRASSVAERTGARLLGTPAEAAAFKAAGAIVAVPATQHAEVAAALLEQGTDVLMEKPIAHDSAAARSMQRQAERSGRRLFVACNMRFHPAVQALRQHLPDIGRPLFARAAYGNWLPAMRPDIDYRTLYCADAEQGGALLDGIHEVDYLVWLLGAVTDVRARRARLSELEINADDYAGLLLEHESGACSEIHIDYLQRCKRRGCEIVGTDGTLLWESRGKAPECCRIELFTAADGRWRTLLDTELTDAGGAYERQFEQFLVALNGGEAADLLDAATACDELDAVLAARRDGGAIQ